MGGRALRRIGSRASGGVIWLLAALSIASAAYQLIAIVAALRHKRHPLEARTAEKFPVSILKPVYGTDPGFYEAIRTHALQKYPEFEILFGIRALDDPAAGAIEQLMGEFPSLAIRLIVCRTRAPNGKVGSLIDLANEARYPILIVNDSDISVPDGYIGDVTAPLADQNTGLVTCLYRAETDDWPSRFESFAIATEFMPSTLVARLLGVSEFGLGSTLAFRKADLERIGGFRAIGDYLADDYQLGKKLHSLGLRNLISGVVVSTSMSAGSWRNAWHHQLRWARTIRLSRGGGYAGLPITFASLWVVLAAAAGLWWIALPLLAIRFAMAFACGWLVLGSWDVLKYWYAIPVRDLWGVAIWAAGLFGDTVRWRDRRLRLNHQGKIVNIDISE
jgi:ceramide glucosyltransferase